VGDIGAFFADYFLRIAPFFLFFHSVNDLILQILSVFLCSFIILINKTIDYHEKKNYK
jgi:hypothetical protein